MTHNIKRLFFAAVAISLLIPARHGGQTINGTPIVDRPSNAIEITIVYAPEFAPFMPEVMNNFNRTFAEARNPVTGQPLQSGERPVYITGKDASSGVVMQGIVNAVIAPNNANVEGPTIWSPSVSHRLALGNHQS